MLQQVGRHPRRAVLLQIKRARGDDAGRFAQLARQQGGIAKRAGADRDIDLLGHEIGLPIRNVKLDGDVGITVEKDRKRGTQDLLGDGGADADPQMAARPLARRRHLRLGGLDRSEDVAAAGDEQFALGGQRQLSRAPGQEPHAQPVLDPRHQF
jgi:hypothetical protein